MTLFFVLSAVLDPVGLTIPPHYNVTPTWMSVGGYEFDVRVYTPVKLRPPNAGYNVEVVVEGPWPKDDDGGLSINLHDGKRLAFRGVLRPSGRREWIIRSSTSGRPGEKPKITEDMFKNDVYCYAFFIRDDLAEHSDLVFDLELRKEGHRNVVLEIGKFIPRKPHPATANKKAKTPKGGRKGGTSIKLNDLRPYHYPY